MTAQIEDKLHVKQGRSIARWTLGNGLVVFIKRHYLESRLASLFSHGGRSDAFREATRIDWAAANGFQVPTIVAAGEKTSWSHVQSFLALEELTGKMALHEAIPLAATQLAPRAFAAWKRGLTIALASVVARLHSSQRFHKDLYLCHFFIDERWTRQAPRNWNGQLVIIDLQRLGHHPWTAVWWTLKDLAQLLYSTDVSGITPRDRLRFARHYCGDARRSWRWRVMRWLIAIRWRNYMRHNQDRELPRAA